MNQQEKNSSIQVASQDIQQLQLTLKETLKENKTLQNKNTKLEGKYVEVFKENKSLKQDRQSLISFLTAFFNEDQSKVIFQEPGVGQVVTIQLQNLLDQKLRTLKSKVQELEAQIVRNQQTAKIQFQKVFRQECQKMNVDWQARLKTSKEQQTKEVNSLHRELQGLKKSLENRTNDLKEIKSILQQKTVQLSKVSKQKLKLEHHLNNIRKKEISQQIMPAEDKDQSKTLIDKNQYLSLKQQIESLLVKRDELIRELKKNQTQLLAERDMTSKLQSELFRLNEIQRECDQKYELVRECSLQDLQNMILNFHNEAEVKETESKGQNAPSQHAAPRKNSQRDSNQEVTQRQYLNNLVRRYIRAQTSGQLEKAVTLLQIIGKLVKIDGEATQALQQYKAKQKQWWFIKM